MHRSFRLAFISLFLAAAVPATFAADPGAVDFGRLPPGNHGRVIDVTLGRAVLKFASLVVRSEEPEIGRIVGGLSRIRVHVVGLTDENRAAMSSHVRGIRERLAGDGWDQVVSVQGGQEDDVAIYLKHGEGENVEGLVVSVIDRAEKEVVLVNIVGQIRPEQLAAVAEHLDLDHLKRRTKVVRL